MHILRGGKAAKRGVASTRAQSAAAQAGLQSGDYLVGIGGRPVRSFACLFSWIRSAGDRALVQFVRGDELLEREVKVLRKPRGENGAPAKPGFSTQASPALIDDRD